jgi:hypothetical protein
MKPKLKLVWDVEADARLGVSYLDCNSQEHIRYFLPRNFHYVLSGKFTKAERKKIIREYARHIHKIKHKEIRKGLADTRKEWTKVEADYYKVIDRIFKGHPWPKGNYRGYVSIWHMFPRDIKNKKFWFPFDHTIFNPVSTIAHEMLHFMFFDYVEKNYGLQEGDELASTDPDYLWQVSEIFNNVIEHWPPYAKVIPFDNVKPYPGTEKMFTKMKAHWRDNEDIDALLDKWLKNIK